MVSRTSPVAEQLDGILNNLVLKVVVVAGTTAAANIAVSGIATTDKIVAVVRVDLDATAANIDVDDLTSEASITSAGNIQLSTTNTTSDKLIVFWLDITE